MYKYNLRPMKVLNKEGRSWVEAIKPEQDWAEQLDTDLVGGFAIEANIIPERGGNPDSLRLVLPNRIWSMKLWRVTWANIKDMIYKGLNVRLYNGGNTPNNDRMYILMKPIYDTKSGNYTTYNKDDIPIDHIEFGQPFYVVDCGENTSDNNNYIVFLEHLGVIAVSTLEEIKEYNNDRLIYNQKIDYEVLTTSDGMASAYIPVITGKELINDRGLIIGVNKETLAPKSIAAFPEYFEKQSAKQLVERDYKAHFEPGHIIAPLAKNATPEWFLK